MGIPLAHEFEVPASFAAEGGELVLADEMGSEAVGEGVGGAFGVGEYVDFAVSLLEGLNDFVVFKPGSPA
jgi:hypothetical protein